MQLYSYPYPVKQLYTHPERHLKTSFSYNKEGRGGGGQLLLTAVVMVPFLKRPIRLINPFRGLAFIRKEFLKRGNLFIFFVIGIVI